MKRDPNDTQTPKIILKMLRFLGETERADIHLK
jgi:hypothetical protein